MEKRTLHTHREVVRAILRDLRSDSDLRQSDVAHKLGKPQSFVSKYESGERQLDVVELRAVCGVFGISLEEFVRRLEVRILELEAALRPPVPGHDVD
jgi:transcriptional regulator with XRE-family HTH domain